MNDVWTVRNPGWVLLGWSQSEEDARATAEEIDDEFDTDTTLRREPYKESEHEEGLRIVRPA